jgi:hypothetical protein
MRGSGENLLFEIVHAQEDQGTQGDAAQGRLLLSPW